MWHLFWGSTLCLFDPFKGFQETMTLCVEMIACNAEPDEMTHVGPSCLDDLHLLFCYVGEG